MAALIVVEGVNVVDHLRVLFISRNPFFSNPVALFAFSPERLEHSIVVTVTDSSQAESEAAFVDVTGEGPGGELDPMV